MILVVTVSSDDAGDGPWDDAGDGPLDDGGPETTYKSKYSINCLMDIYIYIGLHLVINLRIPFSDLFCRQRKKITSAVTRRAREVTTTAIETGTTISSLLTHGPDLLMICGLPSTLDNMKKNVNSSYIYINRKIMSNS